MLAAEPVRDFSMPRLAQSLSVGVMSLYTYFPSRDALLLALAEDVYERMPSVPPQDRWQDFVDSWLWTVVRHLDNNPEAIKLMVWSGHVSPGWLRRWIPVAKVLKATGLRPHELAFAMSWFTTAAMGFISAQLRSPDNRRSETLTHLGSLEQDEQRLATELWLNLGEVRRDDVLAFGFQQIIRNVEILVEQSEAARKPKGVSSMNSGLRCEG